MVTMPENSWRLLSRDPLTGAVEHYRYDPDTDRCIIRRSADIEPVIEANKRSANDNNWNRDKSMRLAARIPAEVQLLWLQQYGIRAWDKNHKAAVRRLLNSSDWSHLRVGRHFII